MAPRKKAMDPKPHSEDRPYDHDARTLYEACGIDKAEHEKFLEKCLEIIWIEQHHENGKRSRVIEALTNFIMQHPMLIRMFVFESTCLESHCRHELSADTQMHVLARVEGKTFEQVKEEQKEHARKALEDEGPEGMPKYLKDMLEKAVEDL